jgi:serine/threonine-protein kinase
MPVEVACYVVERTADALAYVHGNRGGDGIGLVHRDINPPNVLLSYEGDVKVADFGIVRARERTDRTTTGTVRGKEPYLAPETLIGSGESPATDVYALGVMLHELVTGRPPLRDLHDVAARLDGAPLPLADEIDPSVAAIVVGCMDITPSGRPSAREVSDWLAAIVAERAPRGGRSALAGYLATVRTAMVASHDHLLDPSGQL